jgi:hypothetical protein
MQESSEGVWEVFAKDSNRFIENAEPYTYWPTSKKLLHKNVGGHFGT